MSCCETNRNAAHSLQICLRSGLQQLLNQHVQPWNSDMHTLIRYSASFRRCSFLIPARMTASPVLSIPLRPARPEICCISEIVSSLCSPSSHFLRSLQAT